LFGSIFPAGRLTVVRRKTFQGSMELARAKLIEWGA
jgi:hypothetical protein